MEDSIGQERVTINVLLYQTGWKIPYARKKSDYQGFIESNWMEDSIVQERVTIKALLYQTAWKIP